MLNAWDDAHAVCTASAWLTAACTCRELDDLQSGAIKKGPLPDSRPEGEDTPQDGDLVCSWVVCYCGTPHALHARTGASTSHAARGSRREDVYAEHRLHGRPTSLGPGGAAKGWAV